MPETNSSKISLYLTALKTDLEATISGIGSVNVMGRHDMVDVLKLAKCRCAGQVIWIVFVGGDPIAGSQGPRLRARFQIHIYDHPALRRETSQHGWEVTEQVISRVHKNNYQSVVSACRDTEVTGLSVESEGAAADVYVVELQTLLQLTPAN